MNYIKVNYIDPLLTVGVAIKSTGKEIQRLPLYEWLRQFNPCGKIYYYALAAFNEGLKYEEVVQECKQAFNDLSLDKIRDVVAIVASKYKKAKLN